MIEIEYTHTTVPNSSWVTRLAHNANVGRLCAWSKGFVYLYDNVSLADYNNLVDSNSVGAALNGLNSKYTGVKHPVEDVSLVYYPTHADANSATTYVPKNLTYRVGQETYESDGSPTFRALPGVSLYDLAGEDEVKCYHWTVHFSIGSETYNHTVEAGTLNEALDKVSEPLEAMGLPVKLVSAEVTL